MGNKIQRIYVGDHYQVYPKTVPQVGLLGYRPLQSDLKDASGHGKDGSWYSGTGTFEAAGGYTGARVTKNSSWYTTQHVITPIIQAGEMTYGGWIRFNSLSSTYWSGLMSNRNNGAYYGIGTRFDYTTRVRTGVEWWTFLSNTTANTWYFFMVTISTSEVKVYLNGQLVFTKSADETISSGTTNWILGCSYNENGSKRGTDGRIRHCAIYNRVLSADEIMEFYNLTKD